ncbi:MAG: sulfatase [Deltaproteobacteria bacterium]|nr:sulfatase [Deltaproteobacteria bacterium]
MTTESRRRIWPFLLAAAAALGAYAYVVIDVEPDPMKARPKGGVAELEALAERDDTNILFIVVDTLRAERMSAYGYSRETTPFLSKLASTGIRLGRNIAQSSWTKSSMASMWSARTPLHVGVTRFNHTISDQVDMPAEVLKEAGFKTIGLYRNGWVNPSFGFAQGFEKYYKPLGGYQDPQIQRMRPNAQLAGTDESLMADATEFLRIHGKTSRWFLYLHLMDVHEYTYDQESALFGNSVSDIYDNSVLREDWVISTLYDYLGRQGLLEKTIVVLISDHGEAFGERGFEGHAREVFPETTETPFIISLPFELSPGVVVKARSSNLDVWPTLLDLIGLSSPDAGLDGRSRREAILAAVEGAESTGDDEVSVAFLDENWGTPGGDRLAAVSVIDGSFRYVSGSALNGRPYEVLLSNEDGQKANRLAANPEAAELLRTKAREILDQTSAFESKEIKLDQMQLDQLRALGYQLP